MSEDNLNAAVDVVSSVAIQEMMYVVARSAEHVIPLTACLYCPFKVVRCGSLRGLLPGKAWEPSFPPSHHRHICTV